MQRNERENKMSDSDQRIIDEIKDAKIVVFDGGAGIFVFDDESQVEINENELLLVLCHLLNIKVEVC